MSVVCIQALSYIILERDDKYVSLVMTPFIEFIFSSIWAVVISFALLLKIDFANQEPLELQPVFGV